MEYSNICANDGCDVAFQKKTHNQKYCSDKCCREATNRKIMERYYENKRLRSGAPRECTQCSATLSKYNLGKVCASCEAQIIQNGKAMLMNQIATITWE